MKTSLKNNKKFWVVALMVIVSLSCLFGIWTVAYAQEQRTAYIPTSDEAVQTEVEVTVKYIFEDGEVFYEEKIKVVQGQLLDSGDLPMLPDNMEFTDEFLFYEVKGDSNDEIIRKVAKIEGKDQGTQTGEDTFNPNPEKPTEDESTQTEKTQTKDEWTQTELTKDDLDKMEKHYKELQDEFDKLNDELKDKDKLNGEQKEKIKGLEEAIDELKEKLKKSKENEAGSQELKKEMDSLSEKIKELEKKANGATQAFVPSNPIAQISPITGTKTEGEVHSQTLQVPTNNTVKETITQTSTTKDTTPAQTKEKEKAVRYPNKLMPKQPANNGNSDSSLDSGNHSVNTNKGVASAPSKARGTVTENKDNANSDYPIHHNDGKDNKDNDMYSADARQFVTFTTKNGKTFHLIINHDEDSENVMLLTEVSEDDILNMVEKKEAPKQEITKEEPEKEEPKPVNKEESSNMGTYLILILIVAGALGAGYYFKVIKKKEDKELEGFEEEDDDFFSEAEESENEADETEDNELE
ncbi:CD1107 family mobile element protein [Eubacterium sp.]|uniref:CD1107 family mobile element protein n=1 Tax=Eubacterium sp. TaxID=142586 RepID=UPI002FCB1FAF